MSTMQYNKNPISLREGKIVIDGLTVVDSVKCEIIFTPDVWTGMQLGERTPSSRWLGAKHWWRRNSLLGSMKACAVLTPTHYPLHEQPKHLPTLSLHPRPKLNSQPHAS